MLINIFTRFTLNNKSRLEKLVIVSSFVYICYLFLLPTVNCYWYNTASISLFVSQITHHYRVRSFFLNGSKNGIIKTGCSQYKNVEIGFDFKNYNGANRPYLKGSLTWLIIINSKLNFRSLLKFTYFFSITCLI